MAAANPTSSPPAVLPATPPPTSPASLPSWSKPVKPARAAPPHPSRPPPSTTEPSKHSSSTAPPNPPAGPTPPPNPFDPTYGAGIVNAYNSYQNLAAGRKTPLTTNTTATPVYGTTSTSEGWDLNTLTTATSTDTVAHYLLNVPGDSTFTSTLVWNRAAGTVTSTSISITDINHFELLLYNLATNSLIESISNIDNVQYLYTPDLAAGIYDLEVVKLAAGAVSPTDTYALAFNAQLLDPSAFAGTVQVGAAEPEGAPGTVPEPGTLGLFLIAGALAQTTKYRASKPILERL